MESLSSFPSELAIRDQFGRLMQKFAYLKPVLLPDDACCWKLSGRTKTNVEMTVKASFLTINPSILLAANKSCLNAYLSDDYYHSPTLSYQQLFWEFFVGQVPHSVRCTGLSCDPIIEAIAAFNSQMTADEEGLDEDDVFASQYAGKRLDTGEDRMEI